MLAVKGIGYSAKLAKVQSKLIDIRLNAGDVSFMEKFTLMLVQGLIMTDITDMSIPQENLSCFVSVSDFTECPSKRIT